MNILVFSWRDPKHPLAGGAEQVIHEHAKGWIKAGYKVTLFSSRFPRSLQEEDLDSVKIVREGYQYLLVQLKAFLFYLRNQEKFDLVIDQFHGLPFFTPLYVRKPKLAVIQETAREVWFLNPLPKPLNWVVGFIGYLGEPIIFLFYKNTHFMTGSLSAKKDVVRFGISKKKVTVVPHGVIVKKTKPNPKKEKKWTVCFLGVLSKDKGIEEALKCFHILSKLGKFNFWVIGKADTEKYQKQLKEIVKKLNLKNKVKFWGFVSQQKKFELLTRAHLLINPSFKEGWGLVNIEANSVGLPVVAYSSPGLIDSVKHNLNGLLCRENIPLNLANNVMKVVEDKSLYLRLKKGAVEWSKKYSWKKSHKLSLRLLKRIY